MDAIMKQAGRHIDCGWDQRRRRPPAPFPRPGDGGLAPTSADPDHQPMRTPTVLTLTLLLAACGTDPDPAATPAPSPTLFTPTTAPSPSYDPALKTGFGTEPGDDPVSGRTYTWKVGGTGTDRLRPGVWRTEGGPCTFTAPDGTRGRAFEVTAGGWGALVATVRLADGSTFVVVHEPLMSGPGCIWTWEGPLS